MEVIRGIARNRLSANGDALDVDVAGRSVRLEKIPEKSRVQDCDDLIIAGEKKKSGTVEVYAYRNITRGYVARVSSGSETFAFVFSSIFLAMGIWYLCTQASEIPLFLWLQRAVSFPAMLISAAGALACIYLTVEKFRAWFHVEAAALETVRGSVSRVRSAADGATTQFEVGGRQVEMNLRPPPSMSDGDEVVVAGQRTADVLLGMGYRNVTQGRHSRRWTILDSAGSVLLAGACLAIAILVWPGTDSDLISGASGLAASSTLMMIFLRTALDRFFDWRLDVETWRRIKAAPQPSPEAAG